MGKQSVNKVFKVVKVLETDMTPPDPSGSAEAQSAHGLNYPPFVLTYFNFEDDEFVTVPRLEVDTVGSDQGTVNFWYDVSVDANNIYVNHYSTGSVSFLVYTFLSYAFNLEAGNG